MCIRSPKIPEQKPTPPAPPPAEVLEQAAPDKSETNKAAQVRKKSGGTKKYRAGSNLSIPSSSSGGSSNLNVAN